MIGIRRDREGVMPGTLSFPAEVETGLVKGDVAKLDTAGELVQGTSGDVFDNNARWLVVADFVSGVTGPAASGTDTYDCIVIPLDDELTYTGTVAESGGELVENLVPGDVVDLNTTADGFLTVAAPTDFVVVKVLEVDATNSTAEIEVVKA